MKQHGLGLPALSPAQALKYAEVLDEAIEKMMDHYLDCTQRPGDVMLEYNEALFHAAQQRANITGSSRGRLLTNEHRVCLAMAYVRPEVRERFVDDHRIEINGHGKVSGSAAIYQDLLFFGEEEYPAGWCIVLPRKPGGVWGRVEVRQNGVTIGTLTETLPKNPRAEERSRSEWYEGELEYPDGRILEGRFRLARRRVMGELSAFSDEELDQVLGERERSITSLQRSNQLVAAVKKTVKAEADVVDKGEYPCLVSIAQATGRDHREIVRQLALDLFGSAA